MPMWQVYVVSKALVLLPSQFMGLRLSVMPAFTDSFAGSRLTILQLQGGFTLSLGSLARFAIHTVMHVRSALNASSCPLLKTVG